MFRLHRAWMARLALVVAPALVLACGDQDPPARDAGPAPDDAAPVQDAQVLEDAPAALTWVSFAIAGCTLLAPVDNEQPSCQGPAPLRVQLSAVAPTAIDVYRWELGDGGPDVDAGPGPEGPTPSHLYELPGTYDISLTVRGPGGTATVTRRSAVIVTAAELGARCGREGQCGDSRECVCDAETTCPAPLAAGLCSAGCDAETPCAEGVCANLAAAVPDTPADWQRALCLPGCDAAGACPHGLSCQELPAGAGGGWVQACFAPGVLGSMGSACKDASGTPNHQACAGGLCLDIGARGACAATCADEACPASSACADAGGPEPFCLLRCTAAARDGRPDRGRGCAPPGAPGGSTGREPPRPAGYCAPRACVGPDDCGIDGACTAQGYCGPR
jgi:PKD repeat protein